MGPQAASSSAGSGSGGTSPESEGTAFVLPPAGESGISDVEVTSSGDLVLVGTRANVPFVSRVGTDGVVAWSLEQPVVDAPAFWNVAMLDDGSIALGGSAVESGSSVPAVARVGAGGELLWARAFEADSSAGLWISSLAVEGDAILVNTSDGVVRFTSAGDLVSWVRPTQRNFDVGPPIPALGGAAYLLGTFREEENAEDFDGWVAYLTAEGEVSWQRWYEKPGGHTVAARVTTDDSLVIAGTAFPADTGFVARFTSGGELAWSKRLSWGYGRVGVTEMLLAPEGDILVLGTLRHEQTYQEELLQLRLSSAGDVLESFVFGDDYWFTASHAAALVDDRLIIVGGTSVGALVMVTDSAGTVGGCASPYRFRSQSITIEDADFVLSEADVVVDELEVEGEGLVVHDVAGLAPAAVATEPLCVGRP